ncbi:MAG: DUF11 domain-containing protein, partial [Leptodesmis sp.]
MLMAGGLSCHGPAVYAQTIIPNTATANLRSTPNGSFQTVQSNNTTVPLVAERLEIVKVGDRSAAEPGDTVSYRLLIKNTGNSTLNNLVVTDTLPLGLKYVNNASRASISTSGGPDTPVSLSGTTVNGQVVTFTYPSLAPQQTLT